MAAAAPTAPSAPSSSTTTAAQAADKAARAVQQALATIARVEQTVLETRRKRDAIGKVWQSALASLRRGARAAADDGALSADVTIEGKAAAVVGSTATNTPSHVPQGGPFQKTPSDKATIKLGSATVKINGKAAARNGDKALTCNDPADLPIGTVMATGTVSIGG